MCVSFKFVHLAVPYIQGGDTSSGIEVIVQWEFLAGPRSVSFLGAIGYMCFYFVFDLFFYIDVFTVGQLIFPSHNPPVSQIVRLVFLSSQLIFFLLLGAGSVVLRKPATSLHSVAF